MTLVDLYSVSHANSDSLVPHPTRYSPLMRAPGRPLPLDLVSGSAPRPTCGSPAHEFELAKFVQFLAGRSRLPLQAFKDESGTIYGVVPMALTAGVYLEELLPRKKYGALVYLSGTLSNVPQDAPSEYVDVSPISKLNPPRGVEVITSAVDGSGRTISIAMNERENSFPDVVAAISAKFLPKKAAGSSFRPGQGLRVIFAPTPQYAQDLAKELRKLHSALNIVAPEPKSSLQNLTGVEVLCSFRGSIYAEGWDGPAVAVAVVGACSSRGSLPYILFTTEAQQEMVNVNKDPKVGRDVADWLDFQSRAAEVSQMLGRGRERNRLPASHPDRKNVSELLVIGVEWSQFPLECLPKWLSFPPQTVAGAPTNPAQQISFKGPTVGRDVVFFGLTRLPSSASNYLMVRRDQVFSHPLNAEEGAESQSHDHASLSDIFRHQDDIFCGGHSLTQSGLSYTANAVVAFLVGKTKKDGAYRICGDILAIQHCAQVQRNNKAPTWQFVDASSCKFGIPPGVLEHIGRVTVERLAGNKFSLTVGAVLPEKKGVGTGPAGAALVGAAGAGSGGRDGKDASGAGGVGGVVGSGQSSVGAGVSPASSGLIGVTGEDQTGDPVGGKGHPVLGGGGNAGGVGGVVNGGGQVDLLGAGEDLPEGPGDADGAADALGGEAADGGVLDQDGKDDEEEKKRKARSQRLDRKDFKRSGKRVCPQCKTIFPRMKDGQEVRACMFCVVRLEDVTSGAIVVEEEIPDLAPPVSGSGGWSVAAPIRQAVNVELFNGTAVQRSNWVSVKPGAYDVGRALPPEHPLHHAAPRIEFINPFFKSNLKAKCPACKVGELGPKGVDGTGPRTVYSIAQPHGLSLSTSVVCRHPLCNFETSAASSRLTDVLPRMTPEFRIFQDNPVAFMSRDLEALVNNPVCPAARLQALTEDERDRCYLELLSRWASVGGRGQFPSKDELLPRVLTARTINTHYKDHAQRREPFISRCMKRELARSTSIAMDHMFAYRMIFVFFLNQRGAVIGFIQPPDRSDKWIRKWFAAAVAEVPSLKKNITIIWTDVAPEGEEAAGRYREYFPFAVECLDGMHFLQDVGRDLAPGSPAVPSIFAALKGAIWQLNLGDVDQVAIVVAPGVNMELARGMVLYNAMTLKKFSRSIRRSLRRYDDAYARLEAVLAWASCLHFESIPAVSQRWDPVRYLRRLKALCRSAPLLEGADYEEVVPSYHATLKEYKSKRFTSRNELTHSKFRKRLAVNSGKVLAHYKGCDTGLAMLAASEPEPVKRGGMSVGAIEAWFKSYEVAPEGAEAVVFCSERAPMTGMPGSSSIPVGLRISMDDASFADALKKEDEQEEEDERAAADGQSSSGAEAEKGVLVAGSGLTWDSFLDLPEAFLGPPEGLEDLSTTAGTSSGASSSSGGSLPGFKACPPELLAQRKPPTPWLPSPTDCNPDLDMLAWEMGLALQDAKKRRNTPQRQWGSSMQDFSFATKYTSQRQGELLTELVQNNPSIAKLPRPEGAKLLHQKYESMREKMKTDPERVGSVPPPLEVLAVSEFLRQLYATEMYPKGGVPGAPEPGVSGTVLIAGAKAGDNKAPSSSSGRAQGSRVAGVGGASSSGAAFGGAGTPSKSAGGNGIGGAVLGGFGLALRSESARAPPPPVVAARKESGASKKRSAGSSSARPIKARGAPRRAATAASSAKAGKLSAGKAIVAAAKKFKCPTSIEDLLSSGSADESEVSSADSDVGKAGAHSSKKSLSDEDADAGGFFSSGGGSSAKPAGGRSRRGGSARAAASSSAAAVVVEGAADEDELGAFPVSAEGVVCEEIRTLQEEVVRVSSKRTSENAAKMQPQKLHLCNICGYVRDRTTHSKKPNESGTAGALMYNLYFCPWHPIFRRGDLFPAAAELDPKGWFEEDMPADVYQAQYQPAICPRCRLCVDSPPPPSSGGSVSGAPSCYFKQPQMKGSRDKPKLWHCGTKDAPGTHGGPSPDKRNAKRVRQAEELNRRSWRTVGGPFVFFVHIVEPHRPNTRMTHKSMFNLRCYSLELPKD